MVLIESYNINNFICNIIKYSLGYGFKIYYKEVKRGKHVAQNFVYFINYDDCKKRLNDELERLKVLEDVTGSVTLEAWYNSYKDII